MPDKTYQEDYVTLNIKELFWAVLCRWRAILAVMLILCAVLGAYGAYKEYKNYSSSEIREEKQKAYETELASYEANKEQLETDLENLKEELNRQEVYQENSLMLQIDQYDVFTITAAYYIDSGYEIAPELYFQNPNYTTAVTMSYQAALNRIDLDALVKTPEQPELTAINPVNGTKKLITVTTDPANGFLTVAVSADTEERAEKIYQAVKDTLAEQESVLSQIISEHSIKLMSEQKQSMIDLEYGKLQESFSANLKTINESIKKTNTSLSELKEPVNTVPTVKTVIKAGVKNALIGAVAGLLLTGLYLLFKLVLQDRLNSTEELPLRYQLPLLGTLPQAGAKTRKIDVRFARALGMNTGKSSKEAAEYLAASIRLHLDHAGRVLLVGSCGEDKLNALKEQIAPLLEETQVEVSGNVNENAAAVKALQGDAAVICVEEWRRTAHKSIRHELQTVKESGKQNLGFIVVS